jgi:hypothetical protein
VRPFAEYAKAWDDLLGACDCHPREALLTDTECRLMDARDELFTMVHSGPNADIFLALQARHIFGAIGEHAEQINASSYRPVFAVLQSYASDIFVLAVTRLLEREKNYPLRSVHGVLEFLRVHASEIPLKEPVFVIQALLRLGYESDAFGGAGQTAAVVGVLLGRLPHYADNVALDALRTLRDKRIAHPERLEAESLPTTTWEDAETLLKIPIEALAVCGAYLSTGYVDNEGHLFMDSDAQMAANSIRRLLGEIGILPS